MIIPVTYKCWACGSQVTKYEDITTIPQVPALTKWNICKECKNK